jgi:hypothetical protein
VKLINKLLVTCIHKVSEHVISWVFFMGEKGGHEELGFIKKDLYNFTDHQAKGLK